MSFCGHKHLLPREGLADVVFPLPADLKQEGLKFLAAGLAAAALLQGSPAQAGIEFVKPEIRKVLRAWGRGRERQAPQQQRRQLFGVCTGKNLGRSS